MFSSGNAYAIGRSEEQLMAYAGNSLFNIVVDTDGIATQLSGIMNREKSGRATFMPLNRLNPDRVSMPEDLRANARPIIEQIKFDPKYEKAMQQVRCPSFGVFPHMQ